VECSREGCPGELSCSFLDTIENLIRMFIFTFKSICIVFVKVRIVTMWSVQTFNVQLNNTFLWDNVVPFVQVFYTEIRHSSYD
jgi:hypothetical protein